MTTLEQEPGRSADYLLGRLEEQSVALQDLKAGQQDLSRRIDAGYQELSRRVDTIYQELSQRIDSVHQELGQRIDSVHQELGQRIDAGLAEVRAGQRQILITQWVIGGGLIATLIGAIVALIMRGG